MKTRIAALLACMALSAPLAAQQFDTISFGVDGGYPPFDVLAPSGEITGFDIDIANALCTQLKAKCVFVKQPFESMIAALNAHKFDAIIASLNITDERKKEVDFTDRYYRSAAQLVARKGSPLLPEAASLKGKTVGVQTGSTHEAYARTHWASHGVKIVGYANRDNVYLDLLSGRIDASLQDNIQAATSFVDTPRGQNSPSPARSSATAASRLMSALRSIKTIRHCATPSTGPSSKSAPTAPTPRLRKVL